jgi:hypothetical protein
MAEKVRRGIVFWRKIFGGEKSGFCGGFAIFGCFAVVKTWWVCGGMRGDRGVLCGVFGPLKTRQFFQVYFWVIPNWEVRV